MASRFSSHAHPLARKPRIRLKDVAGETWIQESGTHSWCGHFHETVCEAAGNAIEHAYGPVDATFDVEVSFENGTLLAVVRDRGSWRERRGTHRGRGLNIIEGLMDQVDVSKEQGGTVVRMRRRLGGPRAA